MKRTGYPTREIVRFARQAPGGLIRWHEARDIYLQESAAAREDERQASQVNRRADRKQGGCGYHMGLSRLLKRNFYRVDGVNGYYVLKSTVYNDSFTEDLNSLRQFNQTLSA